jgi:O-antigen ligase
MSGTALTETAPAAMPRVTSGLTTGVSVRADLAGTAAFAGVAVLALVAPFERTTPLVRLPGQSLSNLEAAMAAAFVAWIAASLLSRRWPIWRTPLTPSWLVLAASMTCAALAAPLARLNALHMTGRVAAAFCVFLLAVNALTTRARVLTTIALALAAASVVSVLAIFEYLTVPSVLQWLKAFRPQVMTVGAIVRAGGSLQYPTIASMYLEVVFALGVGLLLAWRDEARTLRTTVVFAALLLVAYAITLTFTRSGLISMAVVIAGVTAACIRRRGLDGAVRLVVLLGVGVAAVFLGSRSLDSIWLRFTTEGQESWYRARITAPAAVTLATGTTSAIPITVANLGRLDWSSDGESPFFLSYHWMLPDEERYVVFDGIRTPFPATVSKGDTVRLQPLVFAPRRPGRFRLVWDIVQERRRWLGDEPDAAVVVTEATVEGPALTGTLPTFLRPRLMWRPGRLVLWRAALQMFAAHPLLGVGPDNYRLTYTSYADLRLGDARTHSNNMYLEMLAGGGLLTAAAFAWFLWCAGRMCAAGLAQTSDGGGVIAIAAAAAGVAILLHGLVDSFLSFAPTYVLFSLTLGIAAACARGVETCADAHRI